MSPSLEWLLITWGSLSVILVVLLIYRSTLTMHEDDQLFLNDSEAHMAKDQSELMAKMDKVTPIVKVLGAVWGVALLGVASLAVYEGLTRVQ